MQSTLPVEDHVAVDGPFGEFTPCIGSDAPAKQIWVAGGAGITPFLSVLRTAQAQRAFGARHRVEFVAFVQTHPWLDLRFRFTKADGHPDREYLEAAGERNGNGVEWYVCGPAALAALVDRVVEDRRVGHGVRLHQEAYEWRRTVPAAAKPSTGPSVVRPARNGPCQEV